MEIKKNVNQEEQVSEATMSGLRVLVIDLKAKGHDFNNPKTGNVDIAEGEEESTGAYIHFNQEDMNMGKLYILAFVLLFSGNLLAAEPSPIAQDFEAKYAAWKEYISQHRIIVQSTAKERIDNPFFRSIVEMGSEALPYIAVKMEQEKEADLLWQAMVKIAKVKINSAYDKTNNRMIFPDYPDLKPTENVYLCWWREGRFKTGDKFGDLYNNWKTLKSEKKDKEAKELYEQIVNLGIPALPYLVEKVESDPEFAMAISRLTGTELPANIRVEECKQWWEKNKQKFELPDVISSNNPLPRE
ncbi:MAG: hypothetical protein PHT33_15780 [bacterium]|nr:hypothetical protein [bacterium]